MNLLVKMLHKRKMLTFISFAASGLTVALTLWWNAQLSAIINKISAGHVPSMTMILSAMITVLVYALPTTQKAIFPVIPVKA